VEISRSSVGRWILQRRKKVIGTSMRRLDIQEGQSRRSGVTGTVRSHATSHIGISRVGAPSCWNGSGDIAKSDTPINSEPSIV
jgi:hypothetical protein